MKLQFLNRHFAVAAFALLAVNAYAYDFKSGDISYDVLSEVDRTVAVMGEILQFQVKLYITK